MIKNAQVNAQVIKFCMTAAIDISVSYTTATYATTLTKEQCPINDLILIPITTSKNTSNGLANTRNI